MEKEYLFIGKVKVDKKTEDCGFISVPSDRLIDPEDLDYDVPKENEEYFDIKKGVFVKCRLYETPGRCLVHHKPKDKRREEWLREAWFDRCPLTDWSLEMRKRLAAWIEELVDIREELKKCQKE